MASQVIETQLLTLQITAVKLVGSNDHGYFAPVSGEIFHPDCGSLSKLDQAVFLNIRALFQQILWLNLSKKILNYAD